jgi:hypothetical protein
VGLLAVTVVFGAGLALVARPLFAEQAPARPTLDRADAVR